MAALTDIQRLTERLVAKAQETHDEVKRGDFDFPQLTQLADDIGLEADQLAALFQQVGDVLAQRLDDPEGAQREQAEGEGDLAADLSPGKRSEGGSNGSRAVDDSSREELYERAKRMGIPGRSEMTKEQLAKAVRRGRRKATTTS